MKHRGIMECQIIVVRLVKQKVVEELISFRIGIEYVLELL
jgi:hypothetical protein